MFNLGFTELLLLGVIALIFIGPSQLPEVARTVGRLLNEWKRATSDFQSTVTSHLTEDVQGRWNEARLQDADGTTLDPAEHGGHGPEAQVIEGYENIDPHGAPVGERAIGVTNHEDNHKPELPTGALPIVGNKDNKS